MIILYTSIIRRTGKELELIGSEQNFQLICSRYFWNERTLKFQKVEGLERNSTLFQIHTGVTGLSKLEITQRLKLFGKNEIIVPLESIFVLFVKEILTPFYVFQVFSLIWWTIDQYYNYAIAISLTSVLSLSTALYQTRKNQKNLRNTVMSSDVVTRICPDGSNEQVFSSDLVPGIAYCLSMSLK